MPRIRGQKILVLLGKSLLGLFLLAAGAVGFGVSGEDARTYRTFCSAVERWQVNPDFRKITPEYASLSYESLQTRPLFVSATDLVMTVRSIPGLPKHLAVSDTSQAHYDNFCSGPLSAYLHLASEQSCKVGMDLLEKMGDDSEERCRWFLKCFSTTPPIVIDEGSIESVRRMWQETDGSREYVIRSLLAAPDAAGHPRTMLHPYIEAMARRHGYPTDVRRMAPEQQQRILDELDGDLRLANYELWRTKQVNDFLSGIWAQAYGQPYNRFMSAALAVRAPCRVIVPVLLVALFLSALHKRALRRAAEEAEDAVPAGSLEGRTA